MQLQLYCWAAGLVQKQQCVQEQQRKTEMVSQPGASHWAETVLLGSQSSQKQQCLEKQQRCC
jgi:hypothetical protein